MKYSVRRFSMSDSLNKGGNYVIDKYDRTVDWVIGDTSRFLKESKYKDIKPVKKNVGLVRNIAILLKRKNKDKEKIKKYSSAQKDPLSNINTSEANKFKTAMTRLSNTMGSDSSIKDNI